MEKIHRRTPSKTLAILMLLLFLLLPAVAAGMTESEKRGNRIYTQGIGRKPIGVVLLDRGLRGKGKAFPCINCHLASGKGVREGGVQSADITRFNLTKEYTGTRASGRAHPAYTDETLKRAITSCIDPAGTPLNRAHPSFEIDGADLDDLVAYLKILGRDPVAGVTEDAIRVGCLLPGSGPMREAAEDVRAFLSAYFERVNVRGGIYSRRIVFVPSFFDPSKPAAAEAAARDIVMAEDLFCLVANLGIPPGDPAVGVLARGGVPVVAPFVVLPDSDPWAERSTFHLYSSVHDQARVMVDFLAEDRKGPGRVGLLYSSDPAGKGGAAGVKRQARRYAFELATVASFSPGSFDAAIEAGRMRDASVDTVLYFGGPADARSLFVEADRQGWHPRFLAPALMAGDLLEGLLPAFRDRTYLVSPAGIPEPGSREMAEFLALAGKHPGTGRHKSSLAFAYAGAALLEKGLTIPGKGITRDNFVDGLSTLFDFHTGVTPALTYNKNRRVGASGAVILAGEAKTGHVVRIGPWREPK